MEHEIEEPNIHKLIRERNKGQLEHILENLCQQWEKDPHDKFLQLQIQKYGESYERQFGEKFTRSYKGNVEKDKGQNN